MGALPAGWPPAGWPGSMHPCTRLLVPANGARPSKTHPQLRIHILDTPVLAEGGDCLVTAVPHLHEGCKDYLQIMCRWRRQVRWARLAAR